MGECCVPCGCACVDENDEESSKRAELCEELRKLDDAYCAKRKHDKLVAKIVLKGYTLEDASKLVDKLDYKCVFLIDSLFDENEHLRFELESSRNRR